MQCERVLRVLVDTDSATISDVVLKGVVDQTARDVANKLSLPQPSLLSHEQAATYNRTSGWLQAVHSVMLVAGMSNTVACSTGMTGMPSAACV